MVTMGIAPIKVLHYYLHYYPHSFRFISLLTLHSGAAAVHALTSQLLPDAPSAMSLGRRRPSALEFLVPLMPIFDYEYDGRSLMWATA